MNIFAKFPKYGLPTIVLAIVAISTSCHSDRESRDLPTDINLPVVQISAGESTLSLDDIELTLDVIKRDRRGLPKSISILFRNSSSERGCLAIPRPVIEGEDYYPSLPCLCVGMRKVVKPDSFSHSGEPMFLYIVPSGKSLRSLEGVYLDPGESYMRLYDLSSFCIIGHGIGPKEEANFLTSYHAGRLESELRAYIITEWILKWTLFFGPRGRVS